MHRKTLLAVGIVLLPSPLSAQSTSCTTFGNQTYCDTAPQAGNQHQAEAARLEQQRELQQSLDDRTEAARRALMYDRVAEFIAKGDCVTAKRLAEFYNDRGLKRDTAKVCP